MHLQFCTLGSRLEFLHTEIVELSFPCACWNLNKARVIGDRHLFGQKIAGRSRPRNLTIAIAKTAIFLAIANAVIFSKL